MQTISEAVANAIDLAGGALVDKLPINAPVLYALNACADMNLQLYQSSKGIKSIKLDVTLEAGVSSGEIPTTVTLPILDLQGEQVIEDGILVTEIVVMDNFSGVEYVRYRYQPTSAQGVWNRWSIIDIVDDIEDLTQAENEGRAVMLITDNRFYNLSFIPTDNLEVEFWGRDLAGILTEAATLDTRPSIPMEFLHIIALRTALLLLDDLLLLPNAQMYQAFVIARKQSLSIRLRDLEHRWNVHRTGAADGGTTRKTRNYNPREDMGYGGLGSLYGDGFGGGY